MQLLTYLFWWCSDATTEDSEKDGLSVEEHSGSDANDDDPHPHSINQLDTVGKVINSIQKF